MIVTVEELKRLEETDIRDLRREDLDNSGDIVIGMIFAWLAPG